MNRKIIQTALALLVVSLLLAAPRVQPKITAASAPEDRIALYQALLDLTNPWTVMCIAAHPDDEDGTSLIVMRRKYGAHTVSLFSTFGEGGQNAIGPELYEELGAIRARETMAAAEIQGSEPHFLGLKDFGYSKSADEAFKFWGHEEALRRMVLEIRKLRPDVIITNHSVTTNDHGHHQATARLEVEAFDAAADPTRFPEQLKDGVTTWQVQRLFVRARGNQNQTDNAPVVTVDPNEQDPVRGTTFAEQALSALQKHATQGPWPKTVAQMAARFTNSTDGRLPLTRYRLARAAKGAAPVPAQDSHNFLDGLQLPANIATQLALPKIDLPSAGTDGYRTQVLDQLTKGFSKVNYRTPTESADPHRFLMMKARAERAFALAGGVDLQVEPATKVVTPGSAVDLKVTISDIGTVPARVFDCGTIGPSATSNPKVAIGSQSVAAGATVNRTERVTIPVSTKINLPQSAHLYDGAGLGIELVVRCSIEVSGAKFDLDKAVRIDVGPAVEITSNTPSLLILTPQTNGMPLTLKLTVKSNLDRSFEGLAGAFANYASRRGYELASTTLPLSPGESRELSLSPRVRIEEFSNIDLTLESVKGKTRSLVSKLTVPIIKADARVAPNLRVGYIRGFDYSLPNALNALGVESKELSVDELKTADLQKYTSIIVDNRVYESQPELIAANQKLLDYANAGGTLIVFYHKSNEWNPDERRKRPQLAPYKLILGDERITDETAPITFIEPEHPLLNSPNKMGQEDFANWIQERGLYYPKEWDPQFHALLQSNDPGEAPLKGGLLVADYGRGRYIYTSMVWYRELRAGVPGAYRMLANMISYGRGEGKSKK
jgi:LmbE family N-acetylglucosaminyl deacetylase